MRNNAIIFDLDGTLWEVTDTTFDSVNLITNKYGMKKVSKAKICEVFGLSKMDTAKHYFPNLSLVKSLKLLDEIAEVNIKSLKLNGGNLYPNLNITLNELSKKYSLFIVSNSGHTEYIEAFLTSSGTNSYFKDYIGASKIGISKADAINKIINENNIKNAIYVGDTHIDYEETKKCNIPFIHAKYGFDKSIKTKYFINELSELLVLVKKIFDELESIK